MTEDEKGETIRKHLSLIMQHLLPSYAIALLSFSPTKEWERSTLAEPQAQRANESAKCV
jgi:hypothetical protein